MYVSEPVSCTLIEIRYRAIQIRTRSILDLALGGYLVNYWPRRSRLPLQMKDSQCLRGTTWNFMRCAVRLPCYLERLNMWT
jgi:hypothetical protein